MTGARSARPAILIAGALILSGPGASTGSPVCPIGASSVPSPNCQAPDQQAHGSLGTYGVVSTPSTPAADNFTPQRDAVIGEVCWWGFYLDPFSNDPCVGVPGPDDFTITYYLDGGGVPGSLLAGPFDVGPATRGFSGQVIRTIIGDFPEMEFTAEHAPVSVHAGTCYWIQIDNVPACCCKWLWSTAPSIAEGGNGDGLAYCEGIKTFCFGQPDYDFAFCLDTDLADVSGLCTLPSCPGDTNGDGFVDIVDLVNVILFWNTGGEGKGVAADVDGSGTVDAADLSLLIQSWGPCEP